MRGVLVVLVFLISVHGSEQPKSKKREEITMNKNLMRLLAIFNLTGYRAT